MRPSPPAAKTHPPYDLVLGDAYSLLPFGTSR